jgi:hypothetical protein
MGNVTQSCHAQYDAELIEFRKELSQFREMIVDDLDEYARTDIVLPRQYQKIESHLKLITNWPHSSFEQPLRLIGSRKYDRPIGWYLKRSLQTNGIHTKDLNKKNQEKANSLADQIREKTSFKVFEELLPPYVRGISLFAKLDFPDSMTIPIAVEALSNESLSIRVQAWVWLARLGIIAPSGSVIEGWLTFTLKHKTELVRNRLAQVGKSRLRPFYEAIANLSENHFEGNLWVSLSANGSNVVHPAARKKLKQFLNESNWKDQEGSTQLQNSILVLGLNHSDSADFGLLLKMTGSNDLWIRMTTCCSMIETGDPRVLLVLKGSLDLINVPLLGPAVLSKFVRHAHKYTPQQRAEFRRLLVNQINLQSRNIDSIDGINRVEKLIKLLEIFDNLIYWDYDGTNETNFNESYRSILDSALKKIQLSHKIHRQK